MTIFQPSKAISSEKNKFAYHITTTINDSRTSDRMIQYQARERRFGGALPKQVIIPITKNEEELIAKIVGEIVKEDNLNLAAFNVCYDHIHFVLVCEEEEVPKIVKKIKARTARECNKIRSSNKGIHSLDSNSIIIHSIDNKGIYSLRNNGINPVDGKKIVKDGSTPFWAQKYSCKPIYSQEQFYNTIEYIENNRIKHNLKDNIQLKTIIQGFVRSYDDCFKTE